MVCSSLSIGSAYKSGPVANKQIFAEIGVHFYITGKGHRKALRAAPFFFDHIPVCFFASGFLYLHGSSPTGLPDAKRKRHRMFGRHFKLYG